MNDVLKNSPLSQFESSIKSLEQIIADMENDDISLEEALIKYEQGVKLASFCQEQLAYVEQKVMILDQQTNTLQECKID